MMYEKVLTESGMERIKRTNDDGTESWIPLDEANPDYQRYLNPEAEHFTPMVTDAPKP